MDKNTRDIKSINARLNKLQNQLTDNILEVSFGELDTALSVGAIVYNISLSANLKGKIPKDERFILSFPDGSNPLVIQNKKEDLTTSVDTIPIYVDGSSSWEQLIYPSVTYPVGSLISAVNYAANDTNFAAGNDQEVQFNSQGQLAADSTLTFNSSTDTLSATNISGTLTGNVTGDLTGDVTGNVTGDVTGDLTGNVTSTSVLDNGVTATTQADATSNLTVATTEFVMNNAGQDPAGTTVAGYHPIQFNDDGDFGAGGAFDLGYNDTTKVLSANALIVLVNATISGILTAQSTIELGNASDTTLSRISAGVVGIEGKEIVTKNKQRHVIHCGFYHGTSSIVYLPFGYGGTMDSTSSSGYLEFGGYVAPCDGYVDYVVVRGENAGGNTTVGFITAPAGQEVPIISPGAGISDTTNMAVDDTGYRFDNFTNAGGTVTNTFNAGDVIMFTLNTTTQLNDAISSAVLVLDWDNEL